jgi:acetyltransferase-like isoleucine patch superfamily enzyme
MRIGLITYNIQHKKTYDILTNYLNLGYEVTLLIHKFKNYKSRKNIPMFSHRPYQFLGPSPYEIAKNFNLKIFDFHKYKDFDSLDYLIIGGSGIIDEKFLRKKKIINCHSGLIPFLRGLDSFKWAIRNKLKVGNTLHYIDSNIDYGRIIFQKKTPLYLNDSLSSFSERHYQEEISLLSNFIKYANLNIQYKKKKIISSPKKRMPKKFEININEDFVKYKNKFLKKNIIKEKKNSINYPSIKSYAIRNVKFGKNCEIVEPVNLYDCELGNNVFIGPFVEITNGVYIGDNTRVSSHSFICTLVTIGKKCFIGHNVNFTNDKFSSKKLGGSIKNWLATKIGNNVLIGSNSTILPIKVCDNVVIGAGSVVTKNITKPGIYAGNPAKFIR